MENVNNKEELHLIGEEIKTGDYIQLEDGYFKVLYKESHGMNIDLFLYQGDYHRIICSDIYKVYRPIQ